MVKKKTDIEYKKPKKVTSKRTCPNCGKVGGGKRLRLISRSPLKYYLICLRCDHEYLPPEKKNKK
jgi:RNase P subunit RPR2